MNRYKNQQNIINSSQYYKEVLENKKLNVITHKQVYNFEILKSNLLSPFVSKTLYIWQEKDKLYTVSNKFYQNPEYGWLILFTNQIQSEIELKSGYPINIFYPIDNILKGV